MAGITIKIDQLGSEIAKRLSDYSKLIEGDLDRISDEIAEEALETLRTTGDYKNRTGEYRKSFKIERDKKGKKTTKSVYSTLPHRTHLLEKGHPTRNGGRTRAFPHWGPAEKKAAEDFEEKLTAAIKENSR